MATLSQPHGFPRMRARYGNRQQRQGLTEIYTNNSNGCVSDCHPNATAHVVVVVLIIVGNTCYRYVHTTVVLSLQCQQLL